MSSYTELTQEEKDQADYLLGGLTQARGNLEKFAQEPAAKILGNEQKLDLIKYNLIVAIQAAIDTCYHFVARAANQAPKNYAYCFELSASFGIIDADLAKDLKRMAHFRNLLVSGDVDDELVCDVLKNKLTNLDSFEEQIRCFVEKCRPFRV